MTTRMRLGSILYRHVKEEDADLSDHAFMKAVARRYLLSRKTPLIDPNE